MAISQHVGIVGGNGWLGGALVRAAVSSKTVDPGQFTLSSRSGSRGGIADIAAHWTKDNAELAERSDIVILSVRPAQFGDVRIDLRNKLAVSVMAGVTCAAIAEQTNAKRIVRAIPNAAAAIGRSFTPWFATADVTDSDKAVVQAFFAASGEAAEVPEESYINYCVGLTGSGAAFPALLVEAMVAEAVAQGLTREFGEKAARSVVCDASQLFAGGTGNTAAIVKEMIDYRGTTAAALQAMINHGFMGAVSAGLRAAAAKAATIAHGQNADAQADKNT